ncbi:MAG: helix-turn-helix domain-containing protein [Nitrospirota bacterium]
MELLGEKIRDIRSQKELTLKELSQQTNLTTSFLSQVERNLVSPSISSLRKIADALTIKLSSLFEEDDGRDVIFTKKNKRTKIIDKECKATYEILAADLPNIKLKPAILKLKVKGVVKRKSASNYGEEFSIILKGKIELMREGEKFVMKEGDSIYFISNKKYTVQNTGDTEAVILFVTNIYNKG